MPRTFQWVRFIQLETPSKRYGANKRGLTNRLPNPQKSLP
jgi:hypothetical protein